MKRRTKGRTLREKKPTKSNLKDKRGSGKTSRSSGNRRCPETYNEESPPASQILNVIILAVFVMILVSLLVWMIDNNLRNEKSSGTIQEKQVAAGKCFDPEDLAKIPEETRIASAPKKIQRDRIFVSIASYRDSECRDTVYDLFELAEKPENIFVGVCQQNKENEEDCFDRCPDCKKRKDSGHIRVKNFEHLDAKGPCFARYQCSLLYNGEEFFLQIDSHTKFIKHWDTKLIEQWRLCEDNNAVLSTYPPTQSDLEKFEKKNFSTFSKLCNATWNNDGLPQFTAALLKSPADQKPVPSGICSAGMLFFPGRALEKCPFDPYLNFLFFGEELLFSARLWTNGFNFYTPIISVTGHHYTRKGKPKFWSDLKNFESCRRKAITRVKYILKMESSDKVDNQFLAEIDKYGLGSVRSIEEYWKYNNIDIDKAKKTKKLSINLCKDDAYKRLV